MHDWLGSTTDLTDPNGVHRSVYGYAGFGPAWAVDNVTSGGQGTRLTFAGAYADPETGLLDLRARVYDPATGTFTTRDPVTDREDTPYTSAYGYVENRPTSRTDPTGRCSFENQVQSWLHPSFFGPDPCRDEDRQTERDYSLPPAVRSLIMGQDELVEGTIAGYANGLSFGLAPDGQPNDNIWFCLGNDYGLIAGGIVAGQTAGRIGFGVLRNGGYTDKSTWETNEHHDVGPGRSGGGDRSRAGQPVRAPERLEAFPTAVRARGKTPVQGGGKTRVRWKDEKGKIYEWDSRHGTVELYDKRGRHLGEFDPKDGRQLKDPIKNRRIRP
jgi:RHS repeat-associated protein